MIQRCMNRPSGLPFETSNVAFDAAFNPGIAVAAQNLGAARRGRTRLTLLQRALRRH